MLPCVAPILVTAVCVGFAAVAGAAPRLITYDNLPLGTADAPLVLRSYFPDPGLDETVLANHQRSEPSPHYNPGKGADVAGEFQPILGLPASIGVNHGPQLSYLFDTTEGRLLYAWQGGFVDMFPYWGDQERGNRQAYDYLPRLVGTLFYKAAGKHPVEIAGRSVSDLGRPEYIGYDLVKRQPSFLVRFGTHTVRTRVTPVAGELAVRLEISVQPRAVLSYRTEDPRFTVRQEKGPGDSLVVTIAGVELGTYQGYPRQHTFTEASVAAGEQFYNNYGCVACHSTDGSRGHGPTLAGLANRERPLADGATVTADRAYLLESIENPNAKIAEGFPPNYMPPFKLQQLEYDSLILFINSLQVQN